MSNTEELELLTTADVMERTGKTAATITRWVAAGKLKPIHKGRGIRGAYMFAKTDVDAFLEKSTED